MTYSGFCEEISTVNTPIWPGPKITPQPSYARGSETSMCRFLCWDISCTGQRMGELCREKPLRRGLVQRQGQTLEETIRDSSTAFSSRWVAGKEISFLWLMLWTLPWEIRVDFKALDIVLCCKEVLWPLWSMKWEQLYFLPSPLCLLLSCLFILAIICLYST